MKFKNLSVKGEFTINDKAYRVCVDNLGWEMQYFNYELQKWFCAKTVFRHSVESLASEFKPPIYKFIQAYKELENGL